MNETTHLLQSLSKTQYMIRRLEEAQAIRVDYTPEEVKELIEKFEHEYPLKYIRHKHIHCPKCKYPIYEEDFDEKLLDEIY